MKDDATADDWYAARTTWRDEVLALRTIVRATGLTETVKWRHPCYTDRGRNIVIVGLRKDFAVISFLKGALLDDPDGRLVQPGDERSGRYLPLASVDTVHAARPTIEAWIAQAVAVERAGLRVPPLPDTIDHCDELRDRMAADDAFREAFEALTMGRRRGYHLHFSRAKQASTREARITAATPRILAGKGLRDCICGHSKRYPQCDGTHKTLPEELPPPR